MDNRVVEIADILRARDRRVEHQRAMLDQWHAPIISFTMNVAGNIKNDALIESCFREGVNRIRRQLAWKRARIYAYEETCAFTGCEALWAVDAKAEEIKKWMCAIEECDAPGRLMDIDVLNVQGEKLSREHERRCLLCNENAAVCARSRAHPPEALYAKVHEIIEEWIEREQVRRIAECAERALHFEALVTPKPGLVDRWDNGAHRDMDIFSFAASATSLRTYFEDCARVGLRGNTAVPEALRFLGMRAQENMLRVTGGVNTHKGAIYALGILCCAAAFASKPSELFQAAARIAAPALEELKHLKPEDAQTGGEHQFLTCGLTGARGEAAAGFPLVRELALPALNRAFDEGLSVNEAGKRALIELLKHTKDSNILRRRGGNALDSFQRRVEALEARVELDMGLAELNDYCIQEQISPGGSADLLAVAFFVYYWEKEGRETCLQESKL